MTQSEHASMARCLQNLSQFSVEKLGKAKTKNQPQNQTKTPKETQTKPK